MYIPWHKAQFTEEDSEWHFRMMDCTHPFRETPLTEEEIREKQQWDDRSDVLLAQDMRQFFRVGFRQVCDPVVLENASRYWVYTRPNLIHEPMKSIEEVLKVEIVKPPPKPTKSAEEKKFKELIGRHASKRNDQVKCVELYRRPLREIPEFQQVLGRMDEFIRQKRSEIQRVEDLFADMEARVEESPDLLVCRNHIGEFRQCMEMAMSTLQESEGLLQEELSRRRTESDEKLQSHDAEVRKEVTEFLSSTPSPTEVILASEAIHTCVFFMANSYIELLLDFFPEEIPRRKHEKKAVNYPDSDGMTPLMVAASVSGAGGDDHQRRHETCEFLLERSADKDIQTSLGLTAVGYLRKAHRNSNDDYVTFGMVNNTMVRSRISDAEDAVWALEDLLMPTGGPSAADQAVLDDDDGEQASSNEDDEDDGDSDEEDGNVRLL